MKKLLRFSLVLFFLVLSALYSELPVISHFSFTPQPVYAESKAPTNREFALYEVMMTWKQNSGGCPHDDNDFYRKISVDSYKEDGFYGYESGTDAINSSSFVDELLGDGGDERTKCSTIFRAITTQIFGGRKQYLDTLYDTTKVHNQVDGDYYWTNNKTLPGADNKGAYMVSMVNAEIAKFKKMPDWDKWLEIYTKDKAIRANERCKKENNVIVGYITEVAIEGQYSDGKVDCNAVKAYFKENNLANYDVAAETKKLDPSGQSQIDTSGKKDGGATDEGEPCYDGGTFGFFKNPLKWITCGVSQLLASAIDGINDTIEKLLIFNPTKENETELYQVWSRILNISNLLFVIAFLVMVISTALDLGIFSNYTVKKLLPRIIIAAILANLSWEICSLIISIVNEIGGAVKVIILSPFGVASGEGAAKFSLGQAVNADGAGAFQSAVVVGLGTLIYLSIATAGAILLPVISIAFVAAITALVVLLLRRILIILLIIFAPLAFALWALPGGEKHFQRWWKVFIQMMMMYPMIMALFASGVFISLLLSKTGGAAGTGVMTAAISAIAVVLPYFVMPLLFKAASGVLGNITGMVNDRSKGIIDRSKNARNKKMKQKWERDYAPAILQKRSNLNGYLQKQGSKGSWARKKAFAGLSKGVGGYNIEAAMSARNAQEKKIAEDQIATGRDNEWRGLSVNKKAADRDDLTNVKDKDGNLNSVNGLRRKTKDGVMEYKSLGGEWVKEAEVNAAHGRWGKNQFAQQASLAYEIRKADTSEKIKDLKDRYSSLALDQWKNTDRQAGGTWKGATFENQATHMALKHTDWRSGELQADKFANEMYEKKGMYPISNMTAHSVEALGYAFNQGDEDTQNKVRGVMETFVHRGRAGEMGPQVGVDPTTEMPITDPGVVGTGGGPMVAQVSAAGSAHVNEAANKVARQVGVLEQAPDAVSAGPSGGPVQRPYSPQKESGPANPGTPPAPHDRY